MWKDCIHMTYKLPTGGQWIELKLKHRVLSGIVIASFTSASEIWITNLVWIDSQNLIRDYCPQG